MNKNTTKQKSGYFLDLNSDEVQYLTDLGEGSPELGLRLLISEREKVLELMEKFGITNYINIGNIVKRFIWG